MTNNPSSEASCCYLMLYSCWLAGLSMDSRVQFCIKECKVDEEMTMRTLADIYFSERFTEVSRQP